MTFRWSGSATRRRDWSPRAAPVAYTDPGRYGVLDDYWARDGDIVVVTHDHHYDPDGIRSVAREDATLVIYDAVDSAGIDRDVESIDSLADDYDVIRVDDEARVDVATPAGEVAVWSVAAYNDPEGPNAGPDGSVIHPPGFGCGFLLGLGDRTVFWPGDSDAFDGFAELDVSIFLANIGGGGGLFLTATPPQNWPRRWTPTSSSRSTTTPLSSWKPTARRSRATWPPARSRSRSTRARRISSAARGDRVGDDPRRGYSSSTVVARSAPPRVPRLGR